MRKKVVTSIAASPSTTWQIKVVIHPSRQALQAQYNAGGGGMEVEAFCRCMPGRKREFIAELHFHWERLTPALIAHEGFHAALILGRHMHLDLEEADAEEILADAITSIVASVLAIKRHYRREK